MDSPLADAAPRLVDLALALSERIVDPGFRAAALAAILANLEGDHRCRLFERLRATVDDIPDEGARDRAAELVASLLYAAGQTEEAAVVLRSCGAPCEWLLGCVRKPGLDAFVDELGSRLVASVEGEAYLIGCAAVAALENGDPKQALLLVDRMERLLPGIKGAAYERGRILAIVGRVQASGAASDPSVRSFSRALLDAGQSRSSANNDAALRFVVGQIVESMLPNAAKVQLLTRAVATASKQALTDSLERITTCLFELGDPEGGARVNRLLPPWLAVGTVPFLLEKGAKPAAEALVLWASPGALAPLPTWPGGVPQRVTAMAVAHSLLHHDGLAADLLQAALDSEIGQVRDNPGAAALSSLGAMVRRIRAGAFSAELQRTTYQIILAFAAKFSDTYARCATLGELVPAYVQAGRVEEAKHVLKLAGNAWRPADVRPGAREAVVGLVERVVEAARTASGMPAIA